MSERRIFPLGTAAGSPFRFPSFSCYAGTLSSAVSSCKSYF